eukprot:TRINITY_DN8863_c0_g1_i2.p1 TRINITY_DN8863_c0_g1~~TRINITY_DN8863_c0_g1_i2.p1  ORF type:complete len:477 (+),score=84.31 TRINITY_DN8863_c0_g1_i2:153-1433(+)
MPDTPWSISLTLIIVFIPTLLVFFNQIFFMPWGKMAAGVLPPGDLGLPFFGVIFKLFDGTSPQDYVKAVYKKYGGISKYFALGMGGVLVCEPDLRKAVLMNEGVAFETNWPPSVLKAMGAHSVIATSGEVHKTTRALLTRWLSFGFLRGFLPKVEEAVVQSVDQLLKKGSVVCFDEAKDLTFGIMCQLLLSLPPGPLRKELCDLFTTWEKGLFALGTTEFSWTDFGKTMKARREIIKILTQLYLARKTELAAMTNVNDMEPRDILDTFILYGNSKPGSKESGAKAGGYSEEEVCDISLNLLFAGHATTSSAIAWLLYRLYWQPETVEELRVEYDGIAMAKAPGEALTWEDYKNMKLTQRVINETQRMHPIGSDLFRKALKDVKVGEYVIPKGWAVGHTHAFSLMELKDTRTLSLAGTAMVSERITT